MCVSVLCGRATEHLVWLGRKSSTAPARKLAPRQFIPPSGMSVDDFFFVRSTKNTKPNSLPFIISFHLNSPFSTSTQWASFRLTDAKLLPTRGHWSFSRTLVLGRRMCT